MAVTTNTLTTTAPKSQIVSQVVTPWLINASTDDASGCEEIRAAPGAGYAHVIERLSIYIGAAITVTIGSGESEKVILIDAGPAVDKGGGLVGIPATAHGLDLDGGESITISGTTNYDGPQTTHVDTTVDEIVITDTFVAETFEGTETIDPPDSYDTVEGDKIGPLGGAVGTFVLDFGEEPIQLTTNKGLTFDASGAGKVCILGKAFTKSV